MNIKILVICLIICRFDAIAQTCNEAIVLISQTDVNNFPINYPDCIDIEGSVVILGNDISSLDSLYQINSISQYLSILNTSMLPSLKGLQNLRSIGGEFVIRNNEMLNSLEDLEMLVECSGEVTISNNPSLENLIPINEIKLGGIALIDNIGITEITGFNNAINLDRVIIQGNDKIEQISGFNNVKLISNLRIAGNGNLESIIGFESVKKIESTCDIIMNSFNINALLIGFNEVDTANIIDIQQINDEASNYFSSLKCMTSGIILGNIKTSKITGFYELTKVNGPLSILFCDNISDLDNFQKLTLVEQFLIDNNDNLVDINGLKNIDSDSLNSVGIVYNPKLEICHIKSICNLLDKGVYQNAFFHDNGSGCGGGTIFDDSQIGRDTVLAQCIFDDNEAPIGCPFDNSRPGMQVSKITEESYDVSLHYGSSSMMLRDLSVLRLFDLIHYHKMQRDIMFNFDRFDFKTYCDEAEIVARSVYEPSAPPPEAYLDYKYTMTMSEINFFSNFVLSMQTNESVKM